MAIKEDPVLSFKLLMAASIITLTVGCVGFDFGFFVLAAFTDFGAGLCTRQGGALTMQKELC